MAKNPFTKYLSKEDHLQRAVMNFIETKYPKVFAIHVPNEGRRSPFERYKFKYLGGVSGVPDILIFQKNDFKCGLAIELKAGYNKPTDNQKKCLKRLENANWETFWSNSFDDITERIKNYMENGTI